MKRVCMYKYTFLRYICINTQFDGVCFLRGNIYDTRTDNLSSHTLSRDQNPDNIIVAIVRQPLVYS